jgi:hypothetical protein
MIEYTQKRLREAQFLYRRRVEATKPQSMNEPEALEFYLNACLTAARSVPWTMQCEEKQKYDAWLPSWEANHQPGDEKLLEFTNAQRIAIVKRGKAETKSEVAYIPVGELRRQSRDHPAFGFHVSGLPGMSPSQPQIELTTLYFEFEGEKIGVMEICKRYLDYLERFVRAFIDDHKETA